MKRIRLVELLSEIKANIVPFLSIAMFVCLGVGLFLGIQWGGTAMKKVTEVVLEEGSTHDIEVQFSYGLVDSDIEELKKIEGVTDVEPGYISFASMVRGSARYVTKIQSLTERIDLPLNVEGTLPSRGDEAAIIKSWAETHDIAIGDRIVFKHDIDEDDEDETVPDGMKYLNADTLTVTALVDHPGYLSKVAGTYGAASIGSGDIESVIFVTKDAFDIDKFEDGYPVAYLRCDGLRGMNTFTAAYQDRANDLVDKVVDLGDKLGKTRYDKLHEDAQNKIDDAQDELDDADKKIADADKEVTDADQKLADGRQEIADGEDELEDARQQVAEGEKQIADGRRQLDEAAPQLEDGARQLAEGKEQLDAAEDKLSAGKKELDTNRSKVSEGEEKAEAELTAAYAKLEDAQSQYDEGKEGYEFAKEIYDDSSSSFAKVEPEYDTAMGAYNEIKAKQPVLEEASNNLSAAYATYQAIDSEDIPDDEKAAKKATAWAAVQDANEAYAAAYTGVPETINTAVQNFTVVAEAFGLSPQEKVPEFPATHPAVLDLDTPPSPQAAEASAEAAIASAKIVSQGIPAAIKIIDDYQITIGGETYKATEIREGMQKSKEKLDEAKEALDQAEKELNENWAAYNASKEKAEKELAKANKELEKGEEQIEAGSAQLAQERRRYESAKAEYESKLAEYEDAKRLLAEKEQELADGKRKIAEGEQDLEEAKRTLAEKEQELKDAKKKLEDKRAELNDAKAKLADAREAFEDMKAYEWVVFPRMENGGIASVDTITGIMGNVRWAMALLFVLIGLFVCYSAVSRLVNDEVTQIGTKKAVGFHEGEITTLYLSFTAIAVLIGTLAAGIISVFVVQGIMNPVSADSLTLPSFPAHFSLIELLLGGGIELVLILLSTWLAAHGLLKRNAIDLLNGNQASHAKSHFWERSALWQNMSLFSQTVVNNCINDKRRVVATLIGVTGCTALVVTAVTLSNNVSRSLERHYDKIYHFDTLVYTDTSVDGAVDAVQTSLKGLGLKGAAAHVEKLQVRQPNGYRSGTSVFVPMDQDAFEDFYDLISLDGEEADLTKEGIWVSAAYADHMGIDVGDEVRVTEGTGQNHDIKVAGILEYYVLRNEFVLSKEEYVKEFGEEPEANVILTERGDYDLDTLQSALLKTNGYDSLVDDREINYYSFNEQATLLNTVVLVYLLLSALMALVVLLNLDLMFVEEKKRELIILMINGFSVQDAKAYIYRDSIALTIIGIILGVIFGAFMGSITVGALEPSFGHYLKSFNLLAAAVGIVCSAVFSIAVLFLSLRKIPKFDLTDINRF